MSRVVQLVSTISGTDAGRNFLKACSACAEILWKSPHLTVLLSSWYCLLLLSVSSFVLLIRLSCHECYLCTCTPACHMYLKSLSYGLQPLWLGKALKTEKWLLWFWMHFMNLSLENKRLLLFSTCIYTNVTARNSYMYMYCCASRWWVLATKKEHTTLELFNAGLFSSAVNRHQSCVQYWNVCKRFAKFPISSTRLLRNVCKLFRYWTQPRKEATFPGPLESECWAIIRSCYLWLVFRSGIIPKPWTAMCENLF